MFLWKVITTDGQLIESAESAQDMACMLDMLRDRYGEKNIQLLYVEAAEEQNGFMLVGDL